jgi:acyl-lipid omega-6 desaturase (Delta-12 desaturase)
MAADFLIRLFMIQHDCGHGAIFLRRSTNGWIGRIIGVLTPTPCDFLQLRGASRDLRQSARRSVGDIDTLTVHKYLASSPWGRLSYRLQRHPTVMFGVGSVYLFILHTGCLST